MINPDDANTTHSHGSTILAANLEVLLLSVAHNTFPFFFFLRVYGPTGDDSQVTPVINRMPAVLIQFYKMSGDGVLDGGISESGGDRVLGA